MPRGTVFLVIVVLLLIGGIVFLSKSAHEVPTTPIEVDVSRDSNAN